ncbi:3-ketosteroid 9alpha-hydroxylase component KshB [Gordonia araii NBRC 100433]|uniref:3-ketosteroid 9alpha-hydroxylase component KshB n=1 Tax=Gordonia araii NBRC 100433 TaxID=1073574 RepID=G7H2L1_9ACTN|nr:ferredoxin--NADP reductase [Gordonia araii]NNG97742.1 ferredoxin--NADP reductase [Gordonia araii NBRC 100433]GAB10086.1 3-ketosteroid 9alpha-hydroxylase component KshB [Gordonia araii NBRC 100433]
MAGESTAVATAPISHAHELEVVEVVAETPDAVSVVLDVPEQAVSKFRYQPGQFLTVAVPTDREGGAARSYSLSSSPHFENDLIITVKRTPGGYASNWICDNVRPGTTLTVLTPSGHFTPASLDGDILLVGAGSGITPLMSIAKSVMIGGSGTVYLLYANRDRRSTIFGRELAAMTTEFPTRFTVEHWFESERGLPTADGLAKSLELFSAYDAYLCGPAPFMAAAREALLSVGIPDGHIAIEKYRSLQGNPFADVVVHTPADGERTAALTVQMEGRTAELDWPRETKLLDLLLSQGYDAPYSCREGECSSCACTVRSGEVRMLKNDTLVDDDLRAGLTLACQAVPVSDEVTIHFDQ